MPPVLVLTMNFVIDNDYFIDNVVDEDDYVLRNWICDDFCLENVCVVD